MYNQQKNDRIIDRYKNQLDVLEKSRSTLLLLRYQILVIVITIFSASLGVVTFMIDAIIKNLANKLHGIYTILVFWLIFSIILLFVWRYIVNLISDEEYIYNQDLCKHEYLITINQIEEELTQEQRNELKNLIKNVPRDQAIKRYDKYAYSLNSVFFGVACLFLILNCINFDIFNWVINLFSMWSVFVIFFVIGIIGFILYFYYDNKQRV